MTLVEIAVPRYAPGMVPALLPLVYLLLGASARAETSSLAELRAAAGVEASAPVVPEPAPSAPPKSPDGERTPLKRVAEYHDEAYRGARAPMTKEQISALRRLACTPGFIAALNEIWTDGMRDGVEYIFAVVVDDGGRFHATKPQAGEPGRVRLTLDAKRTVAIAHTHLRTSRGNMSRPEPSDADMAIPAPNFTVSEKALYATDPGRAPSRITADDLQPCGPIGSSACFKLRGEDWRTACADDAAPVDWAPAP
jgi:hypothetical protein